MNITINMIIDELKKNDINVTIKEVNKNGQLSIGIVEESKKNIKPLVYVNDYLKMDKEKLSEVIKTIMDIMNNNRPDVNIDAIEEILKNENILKYRVYYTLEKENNNTNDFRVKSCLDGIDKVYRIRLENELNVNGDLSFRISNKLIEEFKLDKEKIIKYADDNIYMSRKIRSMKDIFKELCPNIPDCMIDENQLNMYVVTDINQNNAAAVTNTTVLNDIIINYMDDTITKVAILPSSIYESIVIPITDDMNISYLSEMVYEVNTTQVEEKDRLTNNAYLYNMLDGTFNVI